MDGLELCRRIRGMERTAYTYVILLTALSGREKYLQGMEAGADDFVTKPLDPDGLQRAAAGGRARGQPPE